MAAGWWGHLRAGEPGGAAVGAFLLGSLFISGGLFASALSSDQVVAFVVGLGLCALWLASGHPKVVAMLDGQVNGLGRALASTISALPHYEAFVRGLISLSSTLWFVGLSSLFLGLNAAHVARNRS